MAFNGDVTLKICNLHSCLYGMRWQLTAWVFGTDFILEEYTYYSLLN